MPLKKEFIRDGNRRIIASVTTGYNEAFDTLVRDANDGIIGRTSERFRTTRDQRGELVSINSADPGLLIGRNQSPMRKPSPRAIDFVEDSAGIDQLSRLAATVSRPTHGEPHQARPSPNRARRAEPLGGHLVDPVEHDRSRLRIRNSQAPSLPPRFIPALARMTLAVRLVKGKDLMT
jgi:hypothetical protein